MSKRILTCLAVALGTIGTASADVDLNQHIQNRGFEASTVFTNSCSPALCDPAQFWNYSAPDWIFSGTGGDYRPTAGTSSNPGLFDPGNAGNLTNNGAFINPDSGLNVGWLQPGAYMYQTLDLNLAASTTYTIDYAVGRRLEQGPSNYQITLTAVQVGGPYIDGVNTWRFYGNTSSITPGTWKDEAHSFSGSGIAVGQPLTVWLGAEGAPGQPLAVSGTGQVDFDAAPIQSNQSAVPEPGSIMLLLTSIALVAALAAVRKRSANAA
jgi:hypothetical protein